MKRFTLIMLVVGLIASAQAQGMKTPPAKTDAISMKGGMSDKMDMKKIMGSKDMKKMMQGCMDMMKMMEQMQSGKMSGMMGPQTGNK